MFTTYLRRFTYFLLFCSSFVLLRATESTPDDVVTRHLNSIGTSEVRAGIKSRVVQGTLKFRVLVGGAGEVTGSWGRVSSDRMSNFVMRFGGGDWRGEQFTYDGSKTGFAAATSSHQRSAFCQFISSQDFIIKEGLLGGELSTGWALQNLDANHGRIQVLGPKKVDGKELLGVQYFSKSAGDLQVKIYFDPETYHHVLTVYSMELAPNMGGSVIASPSQREIRYTLEERFSNFQNVDGITLPTNYDLQWTQELQNGTTRVYDWNMTADQVRQNLPLDPANFRVK